MSQRITRRSFFNRSFGIGLGAYAAGPSGLMKTSGKGKIPLIVTSHGNETGRKAVEAGWEILSQGGLAVDAVEKAANIIELDPEDTSVGYGGLPNEDCVVQLDASIMDGKTYNAGSVACIENIKIPSSVARIVMEQTDHVILVGPFALKFAKKWGFKEENLLTEKARKIWLRWRQNLSDQDDWGPVDHLRDQEKMGALFEGWPEVEHHYGTTNVLAVDANGDSAGITTTSGLSFKIPGRIGDSPIIGAGLYVDNEVGAAGATGRGEDVIKSCASYYMVLRMKQGRTPQQACEDALRMIVDKYKKVNPQFFPGETFLAINNEGACGYARMRGSRRPSFSLRNTDGYDLVEGSVVFEE